ncbi:cofilin/tropomyosin family protein [Protomyces lactucae-debilis]|uniref:Cofilin/tropomyosin family protein n=1 Tax=Protomyces lactucae-debilis TaxID=2754530 RepID=A0A1Y2FNZ2_PROLT|nr:cofilin/tropomyosin family protein [Protomyces lactucae-debilis]ORY85683.1 cofilin/tropomyosin family protein [Protomyces lactucae-debilis]
MASESRLFSLSHDTEQLIRKFRLGGAKLGNAYISFSINKQTHAIAASAGIEQIESVDDLVDDLPDNTPRYVLLTYALQYKNDSGRKADKLALIYWIPRTASTEMATLYASAKVWFQEKCDVAKVLEIREADDLTEEFLEERLR